MIDGPILLVILAVTIYMIIYLTAYLKMHPFLVLILAAFWVGFAARMPVGDIVKTITTGFGNTLGGIGIVIVCGVIIGTMLSKSGGAFSIANAMLRFVGKTRSALAMSLSGFVTSMLVFCDSGFVILSPLNRPLSEKTGTSYATLSVALSTGLLATHCLVPPAVGPIIAAESIGANIGFTILLGILVAVPTMLVGNIWATRYAKKFQIDTKTEVVSENELLKKYGKLPPAWKAFMPIGIPIALIAFNSIVRLPSAPFGEGGFKEAMSLVGHPATALLIGVFISFTLIPKFNRKTVTDWVGTGIVSAASIIVITGAGGALGAMLRVTPIGSYLGESLASLSIGVFLPFLIAAALKTAQGSSTVAIITTSAIVAPLLDTIGLSSNMGRVFAVLAIGAGSMTVSHANDSYFWVVSQLAEMDTAVAYRCQTIATLWMGITAIGVVALLSVILL
ncbi:MAG: gluconate transporter [Firmicutes bacterium HGW-Firmicutes-8]|nr:MAG: gluconate transporter [Firmicutes bacterium HGW-Firmicutes-8]